MVLDRVRAGTWSRAYGDILVFSENRGQPANLGAKSSTNMLRLIGDKLLDARHDLVEERLPFQQGAKA